MRHGRWPLQDHEPIAKAPAETGGRATRCHAPRSDAQNNPKRTTTRRTRADGWLLRCLEERKNAASLRFRRFGGFRFTPVHLVVTATLRIKNPERASSTEGSRAWPAGLSVPRCRDGTQLLHRLRDPGKSSGHGYRLPNQSREQIPLRRALSTRPSYRRDAVEAHHSLSAKRSTVSPIGRDLATSARSLARRIDWATAQIPVGTSKSMLKTSFFDRPRRDAPRLTLIDPQTSREACGCTRGSSFHLMSGWSCDPNTGSANRTLRWARPRDWTEATIRTPVSSADVGRGTHAAYKPQRARR